MRGKDHAWPPVGRVETLTVFFALCGLTYTSYVITFSDTLQFSTLFTARCYAECGYVTAVGYVVRPSVRPYVCPPVTFSAHLGWNTSKVISRLNSKRNLLTLSPTSTAAIWSNGNTPKLGGIGHEHKNLQYL